MVQIFERFRASQQIEKLTAESTATIACKIFEYKAELSRKKCRHKHQAEKKLELTLSLVFKSPVKGNEYHWNKHFRASFCRIIYRLKVKHEVTLYMIDLQTRNKNMDRETLLKHCRTFYQTLTEGTCTRIDKNSEPETPRVVKIRRQLKW